MPGTCIDEKEYTNQGLDKFGKLKFFNDLESSDTQARGSFFLSQAWSMVIGVERSGMRPKLEIGMLLPAVRAMPHTRQGRTHH